MRNKEERRTKTKKRVRGVESDTIYERKPRILNDRPLNKQTKKKKKNKKVQIIK